MTKITDLQTKEIDEVLSRFGLKEKEKEVYLALLSTGQTTTTPLGRALDMPTTTVQSILNRLHELGLVSISKHRTRHTYSPYDPSILKEILEEKIKQVSSIIPFLKTIQTETRNTEMKVRIFYRDRITDILNEALRCKSKLVYEMVSAREIQKIIGEKIHSSKRRIEHGVRLKSLRVRSEEIKKYSAQTHVRELREAKFLPKEFTFKSSVMFWDNTIAFFGTKNEGVACLIENKTIKEMFLQIFEVLWSVSGKMETA